MNVDGRFELHNIDALLENNGHLQICRVPLCVRDGMLPFGHDIASLSATGCEIRFVMKECCDQVKLHIHCLEPFMLLQLYYGSFQGGWQYLHIRGLFPGDNTLVIDRPANIEKLRKAAKEQHHPFSPDVMRLCLRSGAIADIQMEGDTRAPTKAELPDRYALFYGSSITHGSLAYLPCQDYASQICSKLGVDLINKGMAGACRLEKPVADYLASLDEPAFCVFELGSNIPCDKPTGEFEAEATYLLQTYAAAHPAVKLFVIDDLIVLDEKHDLLRDRVKQSIRTLNNPNLIYVNGHDMLPDPKLISADFVHPTVEGHRVMADYLLSVIQKHL